MIDQIIKTEYGHPLHQVLLVDEITETNLRSRIKFWKRQLKQWELALEKTRAQEDELWRGCILSQINIYKEAINNALKELK